MIDGQDQSGAGYGNAMGADADDAPGAGGGIDSSGGTGNTGAQGGASDGNADGQQQGEQQQGDEAVQRSETVEAEDMAFEADDDLIDDDDE